MAFNRNRTTFACHQTYSLCSKYIEAESAAESRLRTHFSGVFRAQETCLMAANVVFPHGGGANSAPQIP